MSVHLRFGFEINIHITKYVTYMSIDKWLNPTSKVEAGTLRNVFSWNVNTVEFLGLFSSRGLLGFNLFLFWSCNAAEILVMS